MSIKTGLIPSYERNYLSKSCRSSWKGSSINICSFTNWKETAKTAKTIKDMALEKDTLGYLLIQALVNPMPLIIVVR